jgi:hypothetical protein
MRLRWTSLLFLATRHEQSPVLTVDDRCGLLVLRFALLLVLVYCVVFIVVDG